ncbi:hypothetical protein IMY05_010G0175900 [Salix suchowensis]|nr:hypothetical protein IMY05_010G0175900 [Salix suchowensis]
MPTCLETQYNPCIHACFRHHASIYIIYAWLPVCHLQTPPVLRWPPWMAYEEPCIFTCLLSMKEIFFHVRSSAHFCSGWGADI